MKCDGTERHEHYVLGTSETLSHSHPHSVCVEDFNRLHHHPPVEHEKFNYKELTKDQVYITKTPF